MPVQALNLYATVQMNSSQNMAQVYLKTSYEYQSIYDLQFYINNVCIWSRQQPMMEITSFKIKHDAT